MLAESAGAAEDALDAITLDIETAPRGRGQRGRQEQRHPVVRSRRQQSRAHAHRRARRCRCRFQRRGLRSPRALHGPAPRRRPDGAARAAGGMGCGGRSIDRPRRRQGRVPQPARAGEALRLTRKRHPHGGERRRRRLRRARRILSGGLPDPVCGAPHRPAGEVDRGSPRASARHQSCPRCRMRIGDRVRQGRHDPGAARTRLHRSGRLYPHQRADGRAQHRAGAHRAVPHSARAHRRVADDDQQDAVGDLSRPRPLRGRLLSRAAVRHRRGRSRPRSRRLPPAQSDR